MTETTVPTRSIFRGSVMGAALAVAANVIVFLIGNVGDPVQVHRPGETAASDLPLAAVVTLSIVPILLGGVGLWLLNRFLSKAFLVWATLVVVVTLVSLAAPATLDVDSGSKVVLFVMHIVVGASAIGGQFSKKRNN